MTTTEAAAFLRSHDNYLILTHRRPDGDTIGCAAALCRILRGIGKKAALYPNPEVTETYRPYVEGLWAKNPAALDTVVSVDLAALNLFPRNARQYRERVALAFDHHPSYEGFAARSCVYPERAACGEILYEIAVELGQLTPEVAAPLYVAVATDTGCFVYSNVTANTHRVAAALMETGIDYRVLNKKHFRTKSARRLALEAELLRTMLFFDHSRIVFVTLTRALMERLNLREEDTEDIASLGGLVEGTDCSVTMKELPDGNWKVSLRSGDRVDASRVCAHFEGGGHRAAAGCLIRGMDCATARTALLRAIEETVHA